MQFISIVGTQIMATLNPLLALLDSGENISRISLLYTSHSEHHARNIRQYLQQEPAHNGLDVSLQQVADALISKGNPPPVQEAVLLAQQHGAIIFNLGGGLNFQIAACAGVLDYHNSIFVYPETTHISRIAISEGKAVVTRLNLPDTRRVLQLQGIRFNMGEGRPSERLNQIFKSYQLKLPQRPLWNITAGGRTFDAVWNSGNTLVFLTVIIGFGVQMTNKELLNDTRDLIDLAQGRERLSDLLHRELLVLTDAPLVEERILEEGGGKLKVYRLSRKHDTDAVEGLKAFLEGMEEQPAESVPAEELVETGNIAANNITLALTLGQDPSATLIALWSHRPGKVLLFYTPHDYEVQELKKGFIANAALLPPETGEVRFSPASLCGAELYENILREAVSPLAVNISPGPKSHAFFLALAARLSAGVVYSIENRTGQAVRIDDPALPGLPLSAPPPRTFLAITRHGQLKHDGEIFDPASDKKSSLLFDYFNALLKAGLTPHRLDLKPLTVTSGYSSQLKWKQAVDSQGKKIRQAFATINYRGQKREIAVSGGVWFEKLVAHALARCGADSVNIGIEIGWGEKTQTKLEQQYVGADIFMTELDVAALFGTRYLLVSCKAWDIESFEKAGKSLKALALETKATVRSFGRFARPLIAFSDYAGEPFLQDDVLIIGFATYCDPTALKECIETEFRRKSTL